MKIKREIEIDLNLPFSEYFEEGHYMVSESMSNYFKEVYNINVDIDYTGESYLQILPKGIIWLMVDYDEKIMNIINDYSNLKIEGIENFNSELDSPFNEYIKSKFTSKKFKLKELQNDN